MADGAPTLTIDAGETEHGAYRTAGRMQQIRVRYVRAETPSARRLGILRNGTAASAVGAGVGAFVGVVLGWGDVVALLGLGSAALGATAGMADQALDDYRARTVLLDPDRLRVMRLGSSGRATHTLPRADILRVEVQPNPDEWDARVWSVYAETTSRERVLLFRAPERDDVLQVAATINDWLGVEDDTTATADAPSSPLDSQ